MLINEIAVPFNQVFLQWIMKKGPLVPISMLKWTFWLFNPRIFPLHALACGTLMYLRTGIQDRSWWDYWRQVGYCFMLIAMAIASVGVVKILVDAPRPGVFFPSLVTRLGAEDPYGFPSGHAALMASVCYVLWDRENDMGKFILLTITVWVALARCAAGLHFPLDVVAGGLFAVIACALCKRLMSKCFRAEVAGT